MINTVLRCSFTFILVLLSACSNDKRVDNLSPQAAESVKTEISRFVMNQYALSNAGQFDSAHANFRNASGASQGQLILDFQKFERDNAIPFLRSLDSIRFDLGNFSVEPLKEDIAVVVGQYRFSAQQKGKPIANPLVAFTWVLEKKEGRWAIRHWHTSAPQ